MTGVWLGLGGNVGDVTATMAMALNRLNHHTDISVDSVSAIYKTPPWGLEDQPWFLNCCARIETSLAPEALLEVCQDAERAGDRKRGVRWGPRTIDIDILVFEGVEQVEQRLTVPHPRMLERAFVLLPLSEISPGLELSGQTAVIRAENIESTGVEKLTAEQDWWRL